MSRVVAIALLAGVVIAAADPAFIGKLTGPVTKVRDADTIEVARVPVRLQGIAAPELDEPGGLATAGFASNLMLGRDVECRLTGERNRDRLIGVCFLDGTDLGETLVRATGWPGSGTPAPHSHSQEDERGKAIDGDGTRACDIEARCRWD